MRVYQHQWKDSRTGRRGTTRKWYLEVRDHRDTLKKIAGFNDKAQTEALGKRVESLVGLRVMDEDPSPAIIRWLEGLPAKLQQRLLALDLVDARFVIAAKPMTEHINDYAASLRAKGTSEAQIKLVTGRAKRLCEACGFTQFRDLDATKVEQHLLARRSAKKRPISVQTSNHNLAALKAVVRWMVADGRATSSPLARLKPLNVRVDRRHDRRALTPDELETLIDAATLGSTYYGISGPDRAVLYRAAVATALRRGELASLTVGSFNLGKQPTVTVEAAYSKRRRRDVLPLSSDVARLLKKYFGDSSPLLAR